MMGLDIDNMSPIDAVKRVEGSDTMWYVTLIGDIFACYSCFREYTPTEFVHATYSFLRFRGICLSSFLELCETSFELKFLSTAMSQPGGLFGISREEAAQIKAVRDRRMYNEKYWEKVRLKRAPKIDWCSLGADDVEDEDLNSRADESYEAFVKRCRTQNVNFTSSMFNMNPELFKQVSSESSKKQMWPTVCQVTLALVSVAIAAHAQVAVKKELFPLMTSLISQVNSKTDLYGLLKEVLMMIQKTFPFIAKRIPGYEESLKQAEAKSLFYAVKATRNVSCIAMGYKDYFKTPQSFYDAVCKLVDEDFRFFSEKELLMLSHLKADTNALLKNGKARQPPFGIGLMGGTQTGKTTSVQRLKAIFASIYTDETEPGPDETYPEWQQRLVNEYTIYSLSSGDKYMSGYTDQKMFLFDDVGAVKPEFLGGSELEFILQGVNPIYTPTVQAGVEDKGKVFLQNSSFVMTSNDRFFGTVTQMTCPQAVLRRMGLIAELKIDDSKLAQMKSKGIFDDCQVVTPYRVKIQREADFMSEKFIYEPVLGHDAENKPISCSWRKFEEIVVKEVTEFNAYHKGVLSANAEMFFCDKCKSTFHAPDCSYNKSVISSAVDVGKKILGLQPTIVKVNPSLDVAEYAERAAKLVKSPLDIQLDPPSKKDLRKRPTMEALDAIPEDVFENFDVDLGSIRDELKAGADSLDAFNSDLASFLKSESGDECKFQSAWGCRVTPSLGVDFFTGIFRLLFGMPVWLRFLIYGVTPVLSFGGFLVCFRLFFLFYLNYGANIIMLLTAICSAVAGTGSWLHVKTLIHHLFRAWWDAKVAWLKASLEITPRKKKVLLGTLTTMLAIVSVVLVANSFKKKKGDVIYNSSVEAESIASRTTTQENKHRKIKESIWRLSVIDENGRDVGVSMLAIGDRYALVVNHFAQYVKGKNLMMTMTKTEWNGHETVISTTTAHLKVCDLYEQCDLALVKILSLPVTRSLEDYICHDLPENLELWKAPRKGEEFEVSLLKVRSELSDYVTQAPENAEVKAYVYQSTLSLGRGHCGSLVVCSKTTNIVGILVATAADNPKFGLFVPIPKVNFQPSFQDSPIPAFRAGKMISLSEVDLESMKFTSMSSPLEIVGRMEVFGRLSHSAATRTLLDESVEDLVDPTGKRFGIRHKPTPELAKTTGFKPQMKHALSRAMAVLESVGEPFSVEEISFAKTQYIARLDKTLRNISPRDMGLPNRVLTYEEAVLGSFDGVSLYGVSSMPLDTGAGYPLGGKKSDYIQKSEDGKTVTFRREFREELDKAMALLGEGKRINSFSVACLKDEIVKETKEKSRIFFSVDAINMVLSRCFFAPLAGICSQLPLLTECILGINNHSSHWGDLRTYLAEVGTDFCFDGDYTDYDLSMPKDVIQAADEVMIYMLKWCGFSDLEQDMARTLLLEGSEPNVLMGPYMYRLHKGHISGNFLTYIRNSIVNSIIDRMCYKELTQRLDFDDQVRTLKGGDDVATSYTGVDERYNMRAISKYLGRKGFKYTSASKDGTEVDYKPLSEVTFLKRWFVERDGFMCSPIDPNSIVKMLTWTISGHLHEQLIGSVESALREAFHYGKSYFLVFSGSLREVCYKSPLVRGFNGTYGHELEQKGYFDYERYVEQFRQLPRLVKDVPCRVEEI
jgi:hypothetical protein